MNPLDRKWLRLVLAGAGAAAVLAIAAGIAAADTTISGTAEIKSGGLNLVSPPSTFTFPDTTLSGTTQYAEYASTFEVQDYTGSANGWSITAYAGAFTCDTNSTPNACPSTETLGALETNGGGTESSITPPTATCHSGSDCTAGTSNVTKVTVPTSTPAAVVANQPASSGMGDIDMAVNWWLTVPVSAHVGSYSSTITVNLASGPTG